MNTPPPVQEAPSASTPHVFHVTQGTIDAQTAWDLRPALMKALYTHGPEINVDLSDVSFIDSTGLGMLVGVLKEARDMQGAVRLVNPGREVRRILQVTGLEAMFQTANR